MKYRTISWNLLYVKWTEKKVQFSSVSVSSNAVKYHNSPYVFFFHIKICPAATPLINYISTVVICTCSICGSEILFKQFWGIWSSTWTLKGRLPLYGYKYWHCHKKFYSSTSPESKHQSKLAIYIWGRKSEKYKDMILELRL